MFKKIKNKIKKQFKMMLYIVVCTQLCINPFYGYANSDSNNDYTNTEGNFPPLLEDLNKLEESLKTSDSLTNIQNVLNVKEPILEKFLQFSQAIEEGRPIEFLEEHPEMRENIDLFLIASQRAEVIRSNEVSHIIEFNDQSSRHINIVYEKVLVKYSEESKELIFEGQFNSETVLRQYIPNMDIIDYSHDKGFLVLLDRKKGLLLVDMLFTKTNLGLAPTPVTKLPVSILRFLDQNQLSPEDMKSVDIEFITRITRPPNKMPEGVEINFRGEYMVSAGNVMISYTDARGDKHLLQLLTREDMYYNVRHTYSLLDIMTKLQSPDLLVNNPDALEQFLTRTRSALSESQSMLVANVSSLYTKDALERLNQAAKYLPTDNLSPQDRMTFREWQTDFAQSISEINRARKENPSETRSSNFKAFISSPTQSRKESGTVLTTKDIVNILNTPEQVWKHKSLIEKIRDKNYIPSKEGVVISFILIPIFFYLLNMHYAEGGALYPVTTLHNVIAVGLGLPLLMAVVSFLPYVYNMMFLKKISSHNMDELQKWREKWNAMEIKTKIVSFGLKFVAYTIYPVTHHLAESISPHLLSAVRKGLKPWKKIMPDSDIGRIVGIDKPVSLGLGIDYRRPRLQWEEDENFERSRQLQNLSETKARRRKKIAYLMAFLALTQKGVDPVMSVTFGMGQMNLKKVDINDPNLRMRIMWVYKNLLKEIKKLDEIDLEKELSEMNPEMILKYYKKGQQLAEQMEDHSNLIKKIHRVIYNLSEIIKTETVLRHFTWSNFASFNEENSRLLKKGPTDFQEDRVIREFIGDHIPVVGMPIVMTSRADTSLDNIEKLAVNSNHLAFSGGPHLQELWMNTVAHFFIAGAQHGIAFADRRKSMERDFDTLQHTYKPREIYSHKIEEKVQSLWHYLYNISWDYMWKSRGQPDNFGELAWKRYVARFQSVQMALLLLTFIRWGVTDSTLHESFMGALFFHLAAMWLFGWPWEIVSGGAKRNNRLLAENKQKLENLKYRLSEVSRAMFQNQEELFTQYKEALGEVLDLYGFSAKANRFIASLKLREQVIKTIQQVDTGLSEYLKNFDQNRGKTIPVPQNTEQIQKTAETLMKLISSSPPLPTQTRHSADWIVSIGLGGFFTTYLAVQLLSIKSFERDYLTWSTIGQWALINYMAYFALYQIFAKGYFYKKFMDMETTQKMRRKLGTVWKASTKTWNEYFYENALNLKDSVSRFCRSAFWPRNRE